MEPKEEKEEGEEEGDEEEKGGGEAREDLEDGMVRVNIRSYSQAS